MREYMAPEQAKAGVADQRADISNAFFLIFYEMLVGSYAAPCYDLRAPTF